MNSLRPLYDVREQTNANSIFYQLVKNEFFKLAKLYARQLIFTYRGVSIFRLFSKLGLALAALKWFICLVLTSYFEPAKVYGENKMRENMLSGEAEAHRDALSDARQSPTALKVQRGVMRFLRQQHNFCALAEVTLANGRRCDVLGIGRKGEIWIIEIKSSVEDYRVDQKWPEYKDFCDQFFFAKPPELDGDIFPPEEGLIVADGHGAEILHPAIPTPLPSARRKAMMLKLARLGAERIHTLMDPKAK